ncbi:amino acid transporter AVT1I-like isoform X2 [Solanum lycopersicum]|uniref:amino acid transporter AVT1I-like isoform X2 n=1 Tax=Solanum lycopersicum TaxID=4081 RepID=UPI00374836E4
MESRSVESIETQILEPNKGTSFSRTCFNGINALSGIGIISIPYALSQGGWLCLMLFFLVAIICCYTGLLLQKCMSVSPSIKTYPDIGEFAFGGVLASIVLVFSIFWVGAIDGVGFKEKGAIWRWDGLISAVSMYTFCYCGHAVFPTICNSMKDRSQFPKVLFVCFLLSTITYGSMATMGYLMYGQNLMSQITLNLPTGKISSKIAIHTTIFNPITKYALVVSPIATAIEDKLPLRKSKHIVSYFIRTFLVISTVIVALTVPFFEYVMTFTGALLGVTVSILLPCLCYLKIRKPSYLEVVFIGMILVFGSLVAISGTYTSLKNIISHV